jgi:uncharacterized protein (TIGR00369 family)
MCDLEDTRSGAAGASNYAVECRSWLGVPVAGSMASRLAEPSTFEDTRPMNSDHFRKLENMYLGAPINRLYAPTITVGEGTAEIAITVSASFFHSAGAVHGSVYFKLLDDACFFAASSEVEDVFVLTTSFTTYMTRPVTSGQLVCRGRVVHSGKSPLLAEAQVVGTDGKEVGRGNGAFMRSRIPLGPEIGYAER